MTLLVVAAALIDPAGRVLVAQRPADKQHGGLWEFPGGKVEPGETPRAALVRELDEELGIAIDDESCVPVAFSELTGERQIVLLLYRCSQWRGVPQPLAAAALRWGAPADLAELPMPPADRPLVAALRRTER